MSKELIDPLNTDTYDDRVIVDSPLRSFLFGPAFDKKWDKSFRFRRKDLLQSIRAIKFSLWKSLHSC